VRSNLSAKRDILAERIAQIREWKESTSITSGIAFTPDEAVEATKDFKGFIIDAEFALNPFGIAGSAEITKQLPKLGIKIHTEVYEKDQYEWYTPSKVKNTMWIYFITSMQKCGGLKDAKVEGKTDEEKMKTFAASLIGMNFRWLERMNLEGVAQPIKRILLPEEYLGRVEVPKVTKVETEEVVL